MKLSAVLFGLTLISNFALGSMYVQNKAGNVRGIIFQDGQDFVFRSCVGADFDPATNPEVCTKEESVDFRFDAITLGEKQFKELGLALIESKFGGLQVDPGRLTDINYLKYAVDNGDKTLFVLKRVMDLVYAKTQWIMNNDPICNNSVAFAAGLAGVGDLVREACRANSSAALHGIKKFMQFGQKHYFTQIETGLVAYMLFGQEAIQSTQLFDISKVEDNAYLSLLKYDIEPYVLNKYFKKTNQTMAQIFISIMTK